MKTNFKVACGRSSFKLMKGMTMHLKNTPRCDGPFVTGTEAVKRTFKSEGEHQNLSKFSIAIKIWDGD